MQGPQGRAQTVRIDSNTVLDDPVVPVSSFITSTIISVSGQFDPVTHDIDASEVEVISNGGFFPDGLLSNVHPPSGPAMQVMSTFGRNCQPVWESSLARSGR
jgi:hypothetical protein